MRLWNCRRIRPALKTAPSSLRANDAAKPDMAGGRVHRLALPCGRPVAQAVVGRTEVRAALDHPAREALARHEGRRTARGRLAVPRRREEVCRPLPDVAGHVEEAVAVRREGCRPGMCLRSRRASGSPRGTGPARCSPPALPREILVAPRERRPLEAAACGVLPLGLGRQAPSPPRRRTPLRPRRRPGRPDGDRGR